MAVYGRRPADQHSGDEASLGELGRGENPVSFGIAGQHQGDVGFFRSVRMHQIGTQLRQNSVVENQREYDGGSQDQRQSAECALHCGFTRKGGY